MNNFVHSREDIARVQREFEYPSMQDQYDLVDRKLAIKNDYDDCVLFKYHRNVMYDYAWNRSKHLMECRGHVYSRKTGELLNAPPRKSFNYLENDWWKDIPLTDTVYYAKKYNGFLAVESPKIGVNTTGSLDSPFVGMAEEYLPDHFSLGKHSHHYEVIHENDPHIVDEGGPKSILLATRHIGFGSVDPLGLVESTLAEVLELAKHDKGEGFMVYHTYDLMHLSPTKVKTPYYVGKKKLMRMHKNAIDTMYNNPVHFASLLPVQWAKFPALIVSEMQKEQWAAMDSQKRRAFIEAFEKENYIE